MTETPELEPARPLAEPSPKRPDRRPRPPEDQPLPASAEVDYLGADGQVAAGEDHRDADDGRS